MSRQVKIGLAGNPNSGKTSVFNKLTGLNQKVGNYPGVTVEKVTGKARFGNTEYIITDLPGAYSIYPKSDDEAVTAKAILDTSDENHPDVILYVADYSQLKRNLVFFSQLADLKIPMVLAINKADMGPEDATIIAEAEKTLGVKVIALSAHTRQGFDILPAALQNATAVHKTFWQVPAQLHSSIIDTMPQGTAIENLYATYARLLNAGKTEKTPKLVLDEIEQRHQTVDKLAGHITRKMQVAKRLAISKKLDRVLTHKIAGPFIFLAILYLIFQSIFTLAEYPMTAIENLFEWLSGSLEAALPQGFINNLITRGILPGIAGVVVFLPQIVFLFFFLSAMEESGYMARVAFITDRLMNKIGLSGKSIVPLLSGAACAIPAIMATRNIENKKNRLITILVTPLISCSARLPVYILLISFIVPQGSWWIFNYQALALMGMYLVGVVMAVLAAIVFKFFIEEKGRSFFVMEMPNYQLPRIKNIGKIIYFKSSSFVWQAGRIIVMVSVVLWLLASFGPGNRFAQIENKYAGAEYSMLSDGEKENRIQSEKLSASYAGELGRIIEPAIKPLGYDWKIGIALISSFAAREVFVGTMATIYSLGEGDAETGGLREKLAAEKNPETGQPVFTVAVAFSLMLFYAFALQCVSTIAVVYKETQGIKWPLVQFIYLSTLAYIAGFAAYHILA